MTSAQTSAPEPEIKTSPSAAPAIAPSQKPHGLLPIPDYAQPDLATRPYLLGDLGGTRTDLANKGITFEVDWTQWAQSIVKGGSDTTTTYGGGFDYLINFDLERMGITSGLVRVRAESRYGRNVNALASPISPVNVDSLFPLTSDPEDDLLIAVTDLNYIHFLTPTFAVLVGKLDTADGDANEFAGGRGVSQFMNSAFIANGVFAAGLPYSTLGVGIEWIVSPNIQVAASLTNSADSSTTSGFGEIGDGYLASVEAHFQYRAADLPGGITAGAFFIGDSEFNEIGRFAFEPGTGLTAETEDHTWAVYMNVWQYLYVEDSIERPINVTDGKADHQGVGLFARAGIGDEETDPIGWSLSGGVGGRGVVPGRDNDTFGVGYYYSRIETGRFLDFVGVDDHTQGFEAYYSFSITPAADLTLDAQYVEPALPGVDPAVVLAMRLSMRF